MTTHKVETGDTLTSIAKKYNSTVDAIASANNIKDKNLIYAGDVLKVPATVAGEVTVENSLPVIGYKSSGETGSESISKWKESRPVSPAQTYSDDIKELVATLTGMDFSYDPEKDLAYKLIRDENRKNARLAMEDTMGKALSMTGGYSNSYAQTAAQQAYADQMSKTVEFIPELWEAAYDRYDSDRNALTDSIKLLSDLDGAEFDKYTQLLKQYLAEGEMLFDNYQWESEEAFDRFLDYAEFLQKAAE